MAPPDAYVHPRGAALPPREGRRGPPSPSRLGWVGRISPRINPRTYFAAPHPCQPSVGAFWATS